MRDRTVGEPLPAQDATWGGVSGRVVYENPELIMLLRDTASVELGSAADVPRPEGEAGSNNAIELDDDGLRAVRGIHAAVILSLGCWIIIGAAVWFL